ncbi:Type-2 restriction enzyme PaeR7I [Mycobacteroides abscessus subsp. abscessus]|nr:Type-2 restriction enzyme PaeR7I [Mycobacteroides abscessus subsp. abscessus]SKU77184.1 Type-2 restriction enzyme PaeR7I [Mycobacteroides abscessus subsp. abscessus]
MTYDVEPVLVNWWAAKNAAVAQLAAAGMSNTGAQARNALHMQSIALFVRQMFVDAGLAEADVTLDSIVPGYYRRSKNWDVVAMHKGHLVGVVELKSQHSSPGNNANNRIEEAIGSSVDARAVQDLSGAFGNLGVWAAWCMTFNRDAESGAPIRLTGAQKARVRFPLNDPAFSNMTYAKQYANAIERFISQKVYDAAWMVTTWVNDDGTIGYEEPIPTATAATLATQIEGRVKFAFQALGQ